MSGHVTFDLASDHIGYITIDQRSRRNALSAKMWGELTEALEHAALTTDLKVLVVSGAGDHFAAGADISEFATLYATPEAAAATSKNINAALDALARFPKPTLAKIRGACVGGGCGIALACDIRFSNDTAKFAITPGKLGLVYPFTDVKRLIYAVGISHAKDILFSARIVSAKEALGMGLVSTLTDDAALDQIVHDYALSICATSGSSAQTTKHMFMAFEAGQRSETAATQNMFLDSFSSADFEEGYKAFLEKRKANF